MAIRIKKKNNNKKNTHICWQHTNKAAEHATATQQQQATDILRHRAKTNEVWKRVAKLQIYATMRILTLAIVPITLMATTTTIEKQATSDKERASERAIGQVAAAYRTHIALGTLLSSCHPFNNAQRTPPTAIPTTPTTTHTALSTHPIIHHSHLSAIG